MTLARLLRHSALRQPQAVAVVDGAARLTYAELYARSTNLGLGFQRVGVRRGDRVLLVLRNRLEHVLAWWALQTIGGVATPVNFRLSPEELRYVLGDCGARVVLVEAGLAPAVREAAEGRDVQLIGVGDTLPKGTQPFASLESTSSGAPFVEHEDHAVGEQDLGLILYTSGTTGRPKGVPRTHKNGYAGA